MRTSGNNESQNYAVRQPSRTPGRDPELVPEFARKAADPKSAGLRYPAQKVADPDSAGLRHPSLVHFWFHNICRTSKPGTCWSSLPDLPIRVFEWNASCYENLSS